MYCTMLLSLVLLFSPFSPQGETKTHVGTHVGTIRGICPGAGTCAFFAVTFAARLQSVGHTSFDTTHEYSTAQTYNTHNIIVHTILALPDCIQGSGFWFGPGRPKHEFVARGSNIRGVLCRLSGAVKRDLAPQDSSHSSQVQKTHKKGGE
jgi:hypothetical protein